MTFSDNQISVWSNAYEKELCAKHNLVCDRYSIPVTSGYSEYEIPNYVSNIRSVLYKGKEVHPKGFRAAVLTGNIPFSTEGSVPYEYLYSGKGPRVLKFYPTPSEDVAEYTGDLWTAAADTDGVIVEFYRTSDPTDQFKRLPDWMRRYLLKDYICMKSFTSEGPQQDLRAATYYQARMEQQEIYLSQIKSNLHQAVQNVLSEQKYNTRRMPGRPVLPMNFGIPVRW